MDLAFSKAFKESLMRKVCIIHFLKCQEVSKVSDNRMHKGWNRTKIRHWFYWNDLFWNNVRNSLKWIKSCLLTPKGTTLWPNKFSRRELSHETVISELSVSNEVRIFTVSDLYSRRVKIMLISLYLQGAFQIESADQWEDILTYQCRGYPCWRTGIERKRISCQSTSSLHHSTVQLQYNTKHGATKPRLWVQGSADQREQSVVLWNRIDLDLSLQSDQTLKNNSKSLVGHASQNNSDTLFLACDIVCVMPSVSGRVDTQEPLWIACG